MAARRLETKNFFKIAAAASDFGGPLEEQWFCARLQTMNKGLVVNSEPLARVWSPLLAIVLLVLLLPTLSLKSSLCVSRSAAIRRRAVGQRLVDPTRMALSWES